MAPAARARELERELRLMGPINPLALEEYQALQERYEFLQGQLDDVKASRRELSKVIKAVDEEIVRSEEPTSELQSLMRISYAVFCLKKKKKNNNNQIKQNKHNNTTN